MTTTLVPGANAPLPASRVVVAVTAAAALDVSALLLAADGKVRSDADFVFYNAPQGPGVRYGADGITVDTAAVPAEIQRIAVTASPEAAGASFAGTEPTATVRDAASGEPLVVFTPPRLTSETALVVVELYRRGTEWKVRAVGQGYDNGLAGIATDFGVQVDDQPAAAPAPAAAQPPAQPAPPAPPASSAPTVTDWTLTPPAPATAPAPAPPSAPTPPPPPAPGSPFIPSRTNTPQPAATPPPPAGPRPFPGSVPSAPEGSYGQAPSAPVPPSSAPPAPPVQPPAPDAPFLPGRGTPPAPAAPTPPPTPPAPAAVTLDKGRVSLTKGGSVSLVKDGKPYLSSVRMALGWEPARRGRSIDLDASVVAYDAQRREVDKVWFRNLAAFNGAIQHSGDNLTGAGEGDDEVITVHLAGLPPQVTGLVFTVNSYSGQKFTDVRNAYCRLVDATTNAELVRFELTGSAPRTGVLMCKLIRMFSGEWVMTALGDYHDGRSVTSMVQAGAAAL
jgi:stress response protein SCP2